MGDRLNSGTSRSPAKHHQTTTLVMAWAVDRESRRPVYVGQLAREKTGLACDCVCPACGATLQAVNAGKMPAVLPADAPQSIAAHSRRASFFRHHNHQQGPGCKSRVAELAALRLLAEQGLIEIPAPQHRGQFHGFSKTLYFHDSTGDAVRAQVISRRYVGEAIAILTLDNGREVGLVLRGHQDVGDLGTVSAIITIQVDDPDVALMSQEEILARASISPQWMCLGRHWDDERLQAEADEAARQKALEQLDADPGAMWLPKGATPKQASESLLHWAVKEVLAVDGKFQAPGHDETLTLADPRGGLLSQTIHLDGRMLQITNVRDEQTRDGYRPDLVCTATDGAGNLGEFELLIEIAVTHKVGADKLERIRLDRAACIEIDVLSMRHGGALTLAQLRRLVLDDIAGKRWLHHGRLDAQRQQVRQSLATQQRAISQRLRAEEAQRAERQRAAADQRASEEALDRFSQQWASSLDGTAVVQEYLHLLSCAWRDEPLITRNGLAWKVLDFEPHVRRHYPQQAVLTTKLFNGRGQLAWALQTLQHHASPDTYALNWATFERDFMQHGFSRDRDQWRGLVYRTVEFCNTRIDPAQVDAASTRIKQVKASLAAGEAIYARNRELDVALRLMFPGLAGLLDDEFGTIDYSIKVRAEQKARVEAEDAAARAEELLQAEARLVEQAARDSEVAIEMLIFQLQWNPNFNLPGSEEQAIGYAKLQAVPTSDHEVIRSAFVARQSGVSFADWLISLGSNTSDRTDKVSNALQAAHLVVPKHTPVPTVIATSRRRPRSRR